MTAHYGSTRFHLKSAAWQHVAGRAGGGPRKHMPSSLRRTEANKVLLKVHTPETIRASYDQRNQEINDHFHAFSGKTSVIV